MLFLPEIGDRLSQQAVHPCVSSAMLKIHEMLLNVWRVVQVVLTSVKLVAAQIRHDSESQPVGYKHLVEIVRSEVRVASEADSSDHPACLPYFYGGVWLKPVSPS